MSEFGGDRVLQVITDTIDDALVAIDAGGRIQAVNKATLRLFGYGRAELIGAPVTMLMPDDHARHHDGYIRRYRETGEAKIIGVSRELSARTKSGEEFPIQLWVGEGQIDGDIFYVGVIRDRRARHQLEEMLRQSQKLEAIGHLSGGMAHDFNNLLTVILGNLEILEGTALTPAQARAAARARQAGERAGQLTSRLLAFARRQPLMVEAVDLNTLVADMADMARATLGPERRLEIAPADALASVSADANQVETALLNLVSNARDATRPNGLVRIETDLIRLDDPQHAGALNVPPGAYVRLSVSDDGEGMNEAVASRAFEPFFTTKAAGVGTGLGLSMVYGLMKQLDGHARIYSERGQGTRVCLYFRPALTSVQTAPQTQDVPRGAGELILVVEDDPEVRAVTVARVEALGYRPVEAADAAGALAMLGEAQEIAALLSDVVMPGGLDGHALAREARRLRPGLPIILVSGYSKEMALGNGADGASFLSKPFSTAALAGALARVLKRRD